MTRERMTRFRPYVTEVFVTRGARHARYDGLSVKGQLGQKNT